MNFNINGMYRTATLVSLVVVGVDADAVLIVVSVVEEAGLVGVEDMVECQTQICTPITLAQTSRWVRGISLVATSFQY